MQQALVHVHALVLEQDILAVLVAGFNDLGPKTGDVKAISAPGQLALPPLPPSPPHFLNVLPVELALKRREYTSCPDRRHRFQ